MPPVVFEPTISAGERPKTYALDRAATGTGTLTIITGINEGPDYFQYISYPRVLSYDMKLSINPLRTKLDLSYLKTLYALVIKMDKLILYTEIIAVCFEIY